MPCRNDGNHTDRAIYVKYNLNFKNHFWLADIHTVNFNMHQEIHSDFFIRISDFLIGWPCECRLTRNRFYSNQGWGSAHQSCYSRKYFLLFVARLNQREIPPLSWLCSRMLLSAGNTLLQKQPTLRIEKHSSFHFKSQTHAQNQLAWSRWGEILSLTMPVSFLHACFLSSALLACAKC